MSPLSPSFLAELHHVCEAAADCAKGRAGIFVEGGFTAFDFQRALRDRLGSERRPGMRACRELLGQLPFIESDGDNYRIGDTDDIRQA